MNDADVTIFTIPIFDHFQKNADIILMRNDS